MANSDPLVQLKKEFSAICSHEKAKPDALKRTGRTGRTGRPGRPGPTGNALETSWR